MLENENQTKVHFKMYKDGKRWVTRGLALFAVSLMVGGPVLGTVANVANVEASEVQVGQATGDAFETIKNNLSAFDGEYSYLTNYAIIKNAIANAKAVKPSYFLGILWNEIEVANVNQQLVNVIVAAQNGYDVVKQYTGYTQDAALTQALAKVTADLNGTNLDALVADNKTAVRLGLQADLKLAQDAIDSGKFTQNMDQITKTVTAGNGTFSATQQMNPGDYDKVNDAELKLRDALAGLRQVAKNQLDQEIEVAKSNQDSSTADLTKAIDNANNVSKDNSSDALDMLGADAALQAEVSKVQQKSAHDADTTADLGKTRAENEAAVENAMAKSAAADSAAQASMAASVIAEEAKQGSHYAASVAADADKNNQNVIASSAVAEEAKQGDHYLSSVASDADKNNQNVIASSAVAEEAKQGDHYLSSVAADSASNDAAVQSSIASSAVAEEAKQGDHNLSSVAADSASNDAAVQSSIASSAVAEEAKQGDHYLSSVAADSASNDAAVQSSIASSAVAEEAKQGDHYTSSVAAEAATNNSLADSALISSAAEDVQNALNDVVQDGVRDSKINDLYNHAMAVAQKPTSSDAHETAKTLNNDADQIRNEAKKNYDDKIAAVMKNVDAIYDQARKDGVHADVKKKPYMDIVAEAQNPSEKNAGLEVAKLNDMLQKMVDAINADKASQIDAAAQNVQNALDGAVQDGVRDATINDLYNHAMAEAQKPSSTNARETANKLNDYADQIRNEAKKNYDDKIASFMKKADAVYDQAIKDGVPASVKKAPYMDIVKEAQNPSEKNAGNELVKLGDLLQKLIDAINAGKAEAANDAARSEAIAASQAAEHAIASENAAGQHYADSVAAEASANASLVASASASQAASMSNAAGRESDAAMEQSLATSAAKSAAVSNAAAAGQHNADSTASDASANEAKASSASVAASVAANSEAQSMINAGRDSNAAMESSLAASAAVSQATSFANESARQSNAAMEQSLANSASASQASSLANAAGRESNAAMEQSLANSALASSVAADEAKQGQHYATSVASEAATNNQNVADFNNQKSAAVAEANNEANAQHVANDQNVVDAINNIKNATDADSLTDAVDKAAIAIANAASRNVTAPRVVNTNGVSNTAVSGVNGGVANAGNQASANATAGTPAPVANTTAGAVAPIANAAVATASVNNGAATQAANSDNGRQPKKVAIHDRKAVAEGSKSLHDTQMTNKHTGLLTSLISALVAAVLALFFLFIWKRRKQQEEENAAANADEALLKDVQNTKDSWK